MPTAANVDCPPGLRYVTDAKPGYTRKRRGKSFVFLDAKGKRITDAAEVERIKAIGIPPAYERVWICPQANGHIQATGFDARGRKQYRYHPKWRAERDADKFDHILRFGAKLPAVRERVQDDLKKPGLPREKALAAVVALLEKTLIRVGNAEYARDNQSYGLTTLRHEHVDVAGGKITFEFTGKSGKKWNLSVTDRRVAAVVRKCADIPGHELFKYLDDAGVQRDVTSADVNDYLKEITGEDFSAKDFRTWAGTVLAAAALNEFEKYDSEAQAKKNVLRAIEHVAGRLGNTPAVCRKSYVHPVVVNAYLDDDFADLVRDQISETFRKEFESLTDEEVMVLAFLRKRMAKA